MSHAHMHGGGAPAGASELPAQVDTPAWKLIATLSIAGALAGLLVVIVYQWTLPSVLAHKALVMRSTVNEVLHHPARWDTLYLEGGALTSTPRGERSELATAFVGFDSTGKEIGVAVSAGEPGFAEIINLMIGFDPATGRLLGMKIMDQKETPGLGDKIEKDTVFATQWPGLVAPLKAVKTRSGSNPGEVQAISGATISSRAVTRIINNAVAKWQPLLVAYKKQGAP
ncbi:MAG: FMN-binding protein [Gemmatimonadaceae bacterium]